MMTDSTANHVPLEVMWLDIEYMDGYKTFTVNATAFPDIKALTEKLHS